MILLDTNVVSEFFRPTPDGNVHRWLNHQRSDDLFLSAPVLAELSYGVELLPRGRRRTYFEASLEKLEQAFTDRILPVDRAAAREYGLLMADRDRRGRPVATMDGLIAAIARAHRASVATRDVEAFDGVGVDVINPFVVR
jgi:predicted nucleic acid-binding protein